MPHALNEHYLHIIFATKNRKPFLTPELEHYLYPLLAKLSRHTHSYNIRANGYLDHVHLVQRLGPFAAVAPLVAHLKSNSTLYIKRALGLRNFSWQRGYAAFSVDYRNLEPVIRYVENQKQHHQQVNLDREIIQLARESDHRWYDQNQGALPFS